MRQEIHDKVFNELVPKYMDLSNNTPAGLLKGIFEVTAECGSVVLDHIDILRANAYIKSASGDYLDYLVNGVGVYRKAAKKTTGLVYFCRNGNTTTNIKIKALTIVKSKRTSLGYEYRYIVAEDTILKTGMSEIAVKVIAETEGLSYNLPSFYITRLVNPIEGIDYIENRNNWIIEAGTNAENDELLKSRYYLKWSELITGGTAKAYESWALSIEEVKTVKVFPAARGAGTVDIFISGANGILSNTIIEKVKALIETKRPIGADCMVKSPSPVTVNLNLILHLLPGSESLAESIKQQVIELIDALFVETGFNIVPLKIGEDFVQDKLIAILISRISQIKFIEVITPADDMTITDYQLSVRGTLTVNTTVEAEE